MKELALSLGAYNAMLWRTMVALAFAGLLFAWKGSGWPQPGILKLHLWRGTVTSVMAFLFFWGLKFVPLAEAIALSFISPLIALYLARLLLHEPIGPSAVIASLILASQTFVIPSTNAEFDQFSWTIGTLSSSIVAVATVGAVISHFMPRIPGLRGFVLAAPGTVNDGGPQLNPDVTGEPSQTLQIGEDAGLLSQVGTTFSTLRPSGKAQINGQLINVVSDGAFIDTGTPIEVVEVAGNRVVVRAVT